MPGRNWIVLFPLSGYSASTGARSAHLDLPDLPNHEVHLAEIDSAPRTLDAPLEAVVSDALRG